MLQLILLHFDLCWSARTFGSHVTPGCYACAFTRGRLVADTLGGVGPCIWSIHDPRGEQNKAADMVKPSRICRISLICRAFPLQPLHSHLPYGDFRSWKWVRIRTRHRTNTYSFIEMSKSRRRGYDILTFGFANNIVSTSQGWYLVIKHIFSLEAYQNIILSLVSLA